MKPKMREDKPEPRLVTAEEHKEPQTSNRSLKIKRRKKGTEVEMTDILKTTITSKGEFFSNRIPKKRKKGKFIVGGMRRINMVSKGLAPFVSAEKYEAKLYTSFTEKKVDDEGNSFLEQTKIITETKPKVDPKDFKKIEPTFETKDVETETKDPKAKAS